MGICEYVIEYGMRYGVNSKFIYLPAATNFELSVLLVPLVASSFFEYFHLSAHISSHHTYHNASNNKAPHSACCSIYTTLCCIHIDQHNSPRPSSEAT